ncbi:MAG: universal stress protein [Deltaproteobacteria bacterium]|nr:universal stress protein [Deltaproteobacteria bacterium]
MGLGKNKILLAIDSSDYSFNSVRYVSQMMPPDQTEVVLFNVISRIPDGYLDMEAGTAYNAEHYRLRAWETLQEKLINDFVTKARSFFLERNFPEEAVRVKIVAKKAGITRDILSESKDGYQAVVVGRRGLNPISELVLGSVSHKLIGAASHVPVWVVGGVIRPDKVIVALDSSAGAMKAVEHVAKLGRGADWRITLVHVIRDVDFAPPDLALVNLEEWRRDFEKELRQIEKDMQPFFNQALTILEQAGINRNFVDTRVLTTGSSRAGAIVDYATEEVYGTIVLGRRGLSKVQEFIMGRVSNKVVQLAKDLAIWVIN